MDIARDRRKNPSRHFAAGFGALLLAGVTVAVARIGPTLPAIERSSLLLGTVNRGSLLRQVQGPGRLEPEQTRFVSSITGGRVDCVRVRNGATVTRSTVLLELSNPDIDLQALVAEQQLVAARAQLVTLRTGLATQRLDQTATVTSIRMQLNDRERHLLTSEGLLAQKLIAPNDLAAARDQVEEFRTRVQIEEQRLGLITASVDSQIPLQRDQIRRLRAISDSYNARRASMRVVAGVDGVVQDLTLQPGQWVQSGVALAQVVQPGRLKAELLIPETQARDVAIGQPATVDTRMGVIVRGKVTRCDPQSVNGAVTVDVSMDSTLPQGARPDMQVDGTIEIERLVDVLRLARPVYAQPNAAGSLFRLSDGSRYAERVRVRFGRASVNDIEVVDGLRAGDQVILSDMTRWENVDKLRIK